jgi:uncharacterized pyridoxamine 5'-phosphate oxidase family protein
MNKTPTSDAYDFLKKNSLAVVATSYLNLPYASTVYYVVDEKFNFYFVTKTNTNKYLNLKTNKNVALVVGMPPKHIAVQVRGQATILKNEKSRKRILNEIESLLKKEKKIDNWPIKKIKNIQSSKKDADEEIVYKIIPQHLIFTNLDDTSFPDSISDTQHNIIPFVE